MSESMVERVARAMFVANALQNEKWPAADNPAQKFWLRSARAAMEAMREPTGEMTMAAAFASNMPEVSAAAPDIWRSMIDAALKP